MAETQKQITANISLTQPIIQRIGLMMEQDGMTNRSAWFQKLVVDEFNRRVPVVGVIRDGKVEIKQ